MTKVLNKKSAYNKPLLGLILVVGINGMYPLVILLIYATDMMIINFFPSIIIHQMLATLSLIALYYTPLLKIPTFKPVNLSRGNLYILFPLSLVLIYLAPWHVDRTSILSSFTAISRAVWLVYVWSRLQTATNSELKILAILTLILSLIDGSRSYALMSFIGLASVYRSSVFKKIGLIILIPILLSVVHFVRILIVEPTWSPTIFGALSEGFVGESYWGYYGLQQTMSAGNIFFVQDFFSTMLYPIFGFLKYILPLEIMDPNHMARINIKQQLGEHFFPMAGYVIHVQFLPLGPVLGNISLYIYLFLIRQVASLIFGKNRVYCHWAILFITIKASPEVLMSFIYFIGFYQSVIFALNAKKLRWR
ncbi:hypothetical protein N9M02_01700 [Amylibacter sp.]|nr:hypothetical protein [Amylibacter sp.]